ncbi:MAG: AraC family transcriptional regulator [Candidatus Krumholzibacteria bacterium]|nr:AraC family transcriptional regulator [Candidatus Krumholzibacteria bacterium]MDH4338205.1 AraC family transcriptional regulator [Candidatus Krumholzibacteria bacterium]MDH5270880.1 AraC family transcriptional regulator [Candidatus Krumholzibacteria bacterium]
MQATTRILHTSALGSVIDYQCHCDHDRPSAREYSPLPFIDFVYRGAFSYRSGRQSADFHSGVVLMSPHPSEYVVTHFRGVRDACTIVLLPGGFPDTATPARSSFAALPRTPVAAYLHHALRDAAAARAPRLHVDELLASLIGEVTRSGRGTPVVTPLPDRAALVRYHDTIDCAKAFIHENHARDLSLAEVARHACMSPFHFSRVFKHVVGTSPHRYLASVRLDHAALLLRETQRPVTDICFSTGFNSLEHFIAAFRTRHGASPSAYRRGA